MCSIRVPRAENDGLVRARKTELFLATTRYAHAAWPSPLWHDKVMDGIDAVSDETPKHADPAAS